MQIYRGCDIVTAKATPAERNLVPHHLLDVLDPSQAYSAANYARDASTSIADIENRGAMPIVCGGTGFYLRALLEPHTLAVSPPDEELRARLEAELAASTAIVMHERLSKIDAAAAARLHSNDTHRVLRALEVALSPRTETSLDLPPHPARVFALQWPRERLVEGIDERVEAMVAAGALEETRSLLEQFGEEAPALGSVGYKQIRAYLRGESRWEEAVELWKIATRQYAKRQMTWFRGQTRATWLDATLGSDVLAAAVEATLGDEVEA